MDMIKRDMRIDAFNNAINGSKSIVERAKLKLEEKNDSVTESLIEKTSLAIEKALQLSFVNAEDVSEGKITGYVHLVMPDYLYEYLMRGAGKWAKLTKAVGSFDDYTEVLIKKLENN